MEKCSYAVEMRTNRKTNAFFEPTFSLVSTEEMRALFAETTPPANSSENKNNEFEKSLNLLQEISATLSEDLNSPSEIIELIQHINKIINMFGSKSRNTCPQTPKM